jgi:hypothetical protein
MIKPPPPPIPVEYIKEALRKLFKLPAKPVG